MNSDLFEHLQLKLEVLSKVSSSVITTVSPRTSSVLNFENELIAAAKKIGNFAAGERVALLLDDSYESAVTLLAFKKAQISVIPYLIDFVNLRTLKKKPYLEFVKWVESFNLSPVQIPFDLNNPEHLEGLEKLQAARGHQNPEHLFKTWAACHIDEYLVVPGSFVRPEIDENKSFKRWTLPGNEQVDFFRFFEEYGGCPSFLCSTPGLIYAQAESKVSSFMLGLASESELNFNNADLMVEKLFAAQAFPDAERLSLQRKKRPFRVTALTGCSDDAIARYLNLVKKTKITNPPVELQNFEFQKGRSEKMDPELLEKLTVSNRYDGNVTVIPEEHGHDHTILGAFSTLFTVRRYKGDVTKILNYVRSQPFYKNGLNTATSCDLHRHSEMQELIDFFNDSIELYFEEMDYVYDSFDITLCWGNKSEAGQHLNYHYHPNSFICGIFYLTTGGGGNTVFRREEKHHIVPHSEKTTMWNMPTWQMKPEAGTLVLAPALIDHKSIAHNDKDNPRYSIAFNVMINGWESSV